MNTDTATIEATEDAATAAAFDAAIAETEAREPVAPQSAPAKLSTEKAPPAKAPDKAPEAKSEFPDELLGGVPAKKEEVKVGDDDPLEVTPKGQISHDHFKKAQATYKERLAESARERDAARARISELESKPRELPEDHVKTLAALKADLAKSQEELSRVAFERTPEFQNQFTKKEARLVDLASKAAAEHGVDAKLIQRALSMEGKSRFALLEDTEMSGAALSYVSNLLAQHDQLQAEKSEVLAGSKERLAQWQADQQTQRMTHDNERKATEEAAWNEAGKELEKEFEPFRRVEGNDAWNAQVDANKAEAKALFHDGNISEKDLAKVAHYAVGAKVLHKMFYAVRDKLNAATARIAELQAASPDINGNGHHRSASDTSGMSEDQLAMRAYDEATAGR